MGGIQLKRSSGPMVIKKNGSDSMSQLQRIVGTNVYQGLRKSKVHTSGNQCSGTVNRKVTRQGVCRTRKGDPIRRRFFIHALRRKSDWTRQAFQEGVVVASLGSKEGGGKRGERIHGAGMGRSLRAATLVDSREVGTARWGGGFENQKSGVGTGDHSLENESRTTQRTGGPQLTQLERPFTVVQGGSC